MNKEVIRLHLKQRRAALTQERRHSASSALLEWGKTLSYKTVLSFVSFKDEIDTTSLNIYLAQNQALALPRIEKERLHFYYVNDPLSQTTQNSFGIFEPIVEKCEKISIESAFLILVPGLGFDTHSHRIGYGKGYYDRFLNSLLPPLSVGIGFKEQFLDSLPIEPHDIALNQILLF